MAAKQEKGDPYWLAEPLYIVYNILYTLVFVHCQAGILLDWRAGEQEKRENRQAAGGTRLRQANLIECVALRPPSEAVKGPSRTRDDSTP